MSMALILLGTGLLLVIVLCALILTLVFQGDISKSKRHNIHRTDILKIKEHVAYKEKPKRKR